MFEQQAPTLQAVVRGALEYRAAPPLPSTTDAGVVTSRKGGIVDDADSECQDRIRALFEGVETGIFIIDPETHTLVDANAVAVKMVGATRDKIVGNLCHKFVCPAEKGKCPVTDLGQTVDNSERILLTADGQRRAIIKTVRQVEVGGRKQLLESFLDITDRKRAETELKQRTVFLHSLIDVSPLGIAVMNTEEKIEIANPAFERLFQYSRAESEGQKLPNLIVPEELREETARVTRQCLEQGSVQTTTRRRRKDGTLVDVRLFAARLTVEGKPYGFLSLYEDITAQIQAEEQKAEQHRLADLAARVGAALAGADNLRQGLQSCTGILAANLDVALTRVWTLNERKDVLELQAGAGTTAPESGAFACLPVGSYLVGRIAETGEPHTTSDLQGDSLVGDPSWTQREGLVAFAGYPLKVKDRVLGVLAAFARAALTDATLQAIASVADSLAQFIERKHAEESLRESEDRFRRAFEDAPSGMCMTAPDGRFMHANGTLCAMLGYSAEELQAGAWQQITHPDDMERSRQAGVTLGNENSSMVELEKRYIHKNGGTVWGRVKILPVKLDSGEISHFVTQIEDITLQKQADAAQAFLATLVESSPDAIVGMTLDGAVVSWNRGAQELYGYAAEEMIGQPIFLVTPPERMNEVQQGLEAAGLNGLVIRYETTGLRKNRVEVDVALTLSPIRDRIGKITGIASITHNISERKFREQQTQLQTAALESTANGIVITDCKGRILWVNPAFTRLTGYAAEEALDQSPSLLKSGLQDAAFYKDLWATILRGGTWQGELVNRRKDGAIYTEEMTITPVRGSDGAIHHFVAVKQDVTERKRAQEELLFKTALLETEAETTIDGILVVDGNGRRLQSNQRFAEIFDIPADVLERNDEREMLAAVRSQLADADAFLERVQYLNAHQSEKARDEVRFKDGRYIDRYSAPLHNSDGKYYGRVWYFRDITDGKRAQEELLFKTALLETEAETTIDGILVVDQNWRLLQTNRRFAEIFELPADLLAQNDDKLILEHVRSRLQDPAGFLHRVEYLYAHQSEKARDEFQLNDGRCIDRYTAPLNDLAGKYYGRVWYFRDITDRKRAEHALRENEQRYRELFENASEIIFTTDMDGRFTSLNRVGEQAFGCSHEEAARMHIGSWVLPEYREALQRDMEQMLAGETQLTTEIEMSAQDGHRLRLEVKPRLIWQGNHPVGVQAIARDITGRAIAEMEIRQAQKLESVGRLASGIAHEINTPIQFVGDNVRFLEDSFASINTLLDKFGQLRDAASSGGVGPQLLREVHRTEEETDCAYLLEEIPRAITQTMEGVDRVATIVRAMKEFAHPESKEMASADLNKALQSTITVARNEWKYVAEVDTDFADLPLVACNVGDLNQVFLNLLVNAAHAIADVRKDGPKGRIVIRTEREQDRVHISIADNGSGIPESIRSRIYDPFFTTKEVGRGTGQGLAIARSVVVDRHKGSLTFDSEVGKGTTFHIRLPISPEDTSGESKER